jgi:hypothetical protein
MENIGQNGLIHNLEAGEIINPPRDFYGEGREG